jgi:DnaJ like chaperone protein
LGKLIGGLIGLFSGGLFMGLLGLFVGSLFDKAARNFSKRESPAVLQAVQEKFFQTTFTLIGYLAKSDGTVTQEEVDQTQSLMDKMGLTADHKREAIRLFKVGSTPGFDPQVTLQSFRDTCSGRIQLTQMLMVNLINIALADGKFDAKEESALREVAQGLNFSHLAFEQLLKMIRAQGAFAGSNYQSRQGRQQPSRNQLNAAYDALGVTEAASDTDIKKAYRKLISEYHPDKLMGQGVPEDMIKVATERTQEIQTAYDLIKKMRKK